MAKTESITPARRDTPLNLERYRKALADPAMVSVVLSRADMRALVAEVERLTRGNAWLLSNLPESVQRVYLIHKEINGKFDHD